MWLLLLASFSLAASVHGRLGLGVDDNLQSRARPKLDTRAVPQIQQLWWLQRGLQDRRGAVGVRDTLLQLDFGEELGEIQ